MGDVNMIAAVSRGGAIGWQGHMPWQDREDLAWFKFITMGDVVIFGFETLRCAPHLWHLEGRTVLMDDRDLTPEAFIAHHGLAERTVWIAGGAKTYSRWLKCARRTIITHVEYNGPADAYMPSLWAEAQLDPASPSVTAALKRKYGVSTLFELFRTVLEEAREHASSPIGLLATPEMQAAGLATRDAALIEGVNDPIGAFNMGLEAALAVGPGNAPDCANVEAYVHWLLRTCLGMARSQKIENSDSINGDLGADSLDVIELVMALEEVYNLDVSDDDGVELMTVQNVINYIERRRTR